MKVRCPIFVISAVAKMCGAEELLKEYSNRGLNVTLLEKPFTLDELRSLLLKHNLADGHRRLERWYQTGEKYYFGKGVPQDAPKR